MTIKASQNDTLNGQTAPIPLVPVRWIDTTPVESTDKPCTISSLDLKVHVCGLYADVAETLVIHNPNSRDISVGIAIPMPDRAVVCGYALDIDGQMIDGVVVPQEKARVAFETEQRLGADPGLVEAVKGNVYRTRVYPVPGGGTRTVRLRYVAPLLVVDGTSAFLDAPMPAERLDERSVRIDVELLDCPAPELSGMNDARFTELGTCWSVEARETDVAPDAGIRVALPKLPASFSLVERDNDGETWFVASECVEATSSAAPRISQLTVLWDTSGSRAATDRETELELLRSYCETDSKMSYRLIAFSDEPEPARIFESADELLACISSLRCDGGSDFQALSRVLAELPTDEDECSNDDTATGGVVEACVLFTDGMDTLSGEPFSFPQGWKVLAVVSGTERDTESLRLACGGLAFDLAAAPRGIDALAQTLFCSQLLSGVSGEGIADVLGIGSGSDGRYTVVGRLAAPSTCIAFDGAEAKFSLHEDDAREGTTLARAWAALRVAQLSPRADDNADELLSLGRRFGVVSPATSLLVLESLDQWLRYDIEPPTTWREMHLAWERHRQGMMKVSSEQELADRHLQEMKRAWSELREWWARDYTAPKPAEPGTMFCPQCGSLVGTNDVFCRRCGAHLQSPHNRTRTGTYMAAQSSAPDFAPMATAPAATAPAAAPEPRFMSRVADGLSDLVASIGSPSRTRETANDTLGGTLNGMPTSARPQSASGTSSNSLSAMALASTAPTSAADTDLYTETDSFEFDMAERAFRAEAVIDEGVLGDFDEPDGLEEPTEATSSSSGQSIASVRVQAWMPDADYLDALDKALRDGSDDGQSSTPREDSETTGATPSKGNEAARIAYFEQRSQHSTSPSFFIDCAGWFMAHGDCTFGLRVLTNLAELRIEDAALLRVMAWRLREAGELERALVILRRVLKLRTEDSQSHRDLALVLDELARAAFNDGDESTARKFAEEAGAFYREIALTPWQRRARAIGLFAVEEYNVLRAWADAQTWKEAPQLESLGDGLEGVLDCDLRVTLAWDADETDVDLHVTEPNGEEAYYAHRLTYAGGRVSEDITDGYGPELYEIRHAQDGDYVIRAHYFASHQQTVFGHASCTLTVYTDWGRPTQRQQITSTRLEKENEMIFVGTAAYE